MVAVATPKNVVSTATSGGAHHVARGCLGGIGAVRGSGAAAHPCARHLQAAKPHAGREAGEQASLVGAAPSPHSAQVSFAVIIGLFFFNNRALLTFVGRSCVVSSPRRAQGAVPRRGGRARQRRAVGLGSVGAASGRRGRGRRVVPSDGQGAAKDTAAAGRQPPALLSTG
jgi:hypothetical protein